MTCPQSVVIINWWMMMMIIMAIVLVVIVTIVRHDWVATGEWRWLGVPRLAPQPDKEGYVSVPTTDI